MSTESAAERLTPAVGDALPGAVETYLSALGAGDVDGAAAAFTADAVYARPVDPEDETAAREVTSGDPAKAIAADPMLGTPHAIRLSTVEGDDALVEGWLLGSDGEPEWTFAGSFQLVDDKIGRLLLFRSQLVEDKVGTDLGETETEIRSELDAYFVELGAARFENASAFFSPDGLYSHPPYKAGDPRAEFRGHEELLAGWDNRGPQDWTQLIDLSIQRGRHLLLEGHVLMDGTREGPTGSFISSAVVDDEGKVARYVAFFCAPMVDRLGAE